MPGLTVPAPTLAFRPAPPGVAMAEDALKLGLPPVLLPDGREFTDQVAGSSGFFLYRLPVAGPPTHEVWNDDTGLWEAAIDSVTATRKPRPLLYKAGQPVRWEGVLVAVADKAIEVGAREYYLRAFFRAAGAPAVDGFSSPTQVLRFMAAADLARAGVKITPDRDTATEMEVFLRNAAGQVLGSLKLEASGQVTVSNQAGAAVTVRANGDIEARPASGRSVIVSGPLDVAGNLTVTGNVDARRIFYTPNNAPTFRQWLNQT